MRPGKLLVAGPVNALWAFDPRPLERQGYLVARMTAYGPQELVRALLPHDEVLLLDDWDTDRTALIVVAIGRFLGCRFLVDISGQLIAFTPTDYVARCAAANQQDHRIFGKAS